MWRTAKAPSLAEMEAMAHDVGVEYGRTLGAAVTPTESNRSVKNAMTSIAGLLTAHGFAARAEERDSEQSVVSENCPFGSAATHHPVLCARGDDTCRVTA